MFRIDRAWCYTMLVLALATAASAENVHDLAKFTATKKSSGGKVITSLRPLVRQLAPHDGIPVALHWSKPDGPFQQEFRREDPRVDLIKTLESATFVITTPDGKQHGRKVKFHDERPDHPSTPQPMYTVATLLLTIHPEGVDVAKTQGRTRGGRWTNGSPLKLSESGEYKLSMIGKLVGTDMAFATDEVKFQVAMGPISLAEAQQLAEMEIARHLVDAKVKKDVQASGYLPGMIYENTLDQRVLHYYVHPSKSLWSYDLVRVTQNRTGELIGMERQSIFTCIAEGTLVETPLGPRAVESLREGDEVLAFDTKRARQTISTIDVIRTAPAPATLQVGSLRLTGGHPVYTRNGWVQAANLTPKSELLAVDGRWVPAATAERVDEEIQVFSLTVSKPHTYFAGGVLVHNKSRGWSPDLDDPWYFYWGDKPRDWKKVTK